MVHPQQLSEGVVTKVEDELAERAMVMYAQFNPVASCWLAIY